jgi:hypothetical protein
MPLPSALRTAFVAGLLLTGATTATAQLTAGSRLSFTGTADATDLGKPGVLLDFRPTVSVATATNTGTFATLNRTSGNGVTGSISDLLVGQGRQRISNFLVVGGYRFDLLSLPSGSYGQGQCYVAPDVGQLCTPYQSALGDPRPTDRLSPFYMANVASQHPAASTDARIAFDLIGTVTGPGGATSNFSGTIATTFVGLSFQEVLFGLEMLGEHGQGFPGIDFTGTFVIGSQFRTASLDDDDVMVTVNPEPGTIAFVATGLLVAGAAARRRRRA